VQRNSSGRPRRSWLGAAAAAVLAVPLLHNVAAAAPSAPDEAGARAHFDRGVAAFDAGRFDEAVAEFEAARKLVPDSRVDFNLAETYRELGRDVDALGEYERFLDDPAGDPSYRAQAETAVGELGARVSALRVAAEPQATVAVDGKARGTTPLPRPIRLAPGRHQVSVTKAQRAAFERWVTLEAGHTEALEVLLPPIVEVPAPVPAAPEPHRAFYRSPWLWLGAAVVLGGAAAATWALWPRSDCRGGTDACLHSTPPPGM